MAARGAFLRELVAWLERPRAGLRFAAGRRDADEREAEVFAAPLVVFFFFAEADFFADADFFAGAAFAALRDVDFLRVALREALRDLLFFAAMARFSCQS